MLKLTWSCSMKMGEQKKLYADYTDDPAIHEVKSGEEFEDVDGVVYRVLSAGFGQHWLAGFLVEQLPHKLD